MTLTAEDISAIRVALEPDFKRVDQRFTEMDQKIDALTHESNKRLTAIEVRLDSIEYKLGQIAVFVPFQNAYILPSIPSRKNS